MLALRLPFALSYLAHPTPIPLASFLLGPPTPIPTFFGCRLFSLFFPPVSLPFQRQGLGPQCNHSGLLMTASELDLSSPLHSPSIIFFLFFLFFFLPRLISSLVLSPSHIQYSLARGKDGKYAFISGSSPRIGCSSASLVSHFSRGYVFLSVIRLFSATSLAPEFLSAFPLTSMIITIYLYISTRRMSCNVHSMPFFLDVVEDEGSSHWPIKNPTGSYTWPTVAAWPPYHRRLVRDLVMMRMAALLFFRHDRQMDAMGRKLAQKPGRLYKQFKTKMHCLSGRKTKTVRAKKNKKKRTGSIKAIRLKPCTQSRISGFGGLGGLDGNQV